MASLSQPCSCLLEGVSSLLSVGFVNYISITVCWIPPSSRWFSSFWLGFHLLKRFPFSTLTVSQIVSITVKTTKAELLSIKILLWWRAFIQLKWNNKWREKSVSILYWAHTLGWVWSTSCHSVCQCVCLLCRTDLNCPCTYTTKLWKPHPITVGKVMKLLQSGLSAKHQNALQ